MLPLPTAQLVNTIVDQAIAIQELQAALKKLKQEIEPVRIARDSDSKISSKTLSIGILKKHSVQLPP
jgi:hypothetical protein